MNETIHLCIGAICARRCSSTASLSDGTRHSKTARAAQRYSSMASHGPLPSNGGVSIAPGSPFREVMSASAKNRCGPTYGGSCSIRTATSSVGAMPRNIEHQWCRRHLIRLGTMRIDVRDVAAAVRLHSRNEARHIDGDRLTFVSTWTLLIGSPPGRVGALENLPLSRWRQSQQQCCNRDHLHVTFRAKMGDRIVAPQPGWVLTVRRRVLEFHRPGGDPEKGGMCCY
jgi:hypothetical protein